MNITNQIYAIHNEAYNLHEDENRFKNFLLYNKKENEIYEKMKALDDSVGDKLAPGKMLSFGVADGKAHYIVLKVLKNTVQVVWIPLGDGYTFSGISYPKDNGIGVLFRDIAEREIGFSQIFKKK